MMTLLKVSAIHIDIRGRLKAGYPIDTFIKSQKTTFYLAGKGFPSPAA